ncbi:MAG: hypothetical protein JJV93_02615 [Alphaproteobacteria bacterium]|nr:hypothetical protein [Alphaproteobacteria bacterium]
MEFNFIFWIVLIIVASVIVSGKNSNLYSIAVNFVRILLGLIGLIVVIFLSYFFFISLLYFTAFLFAVIALIYIVNLITNIFDRR